MSGPRDVPEPGQEVTVNTDKHRGPSSWSISRPVGTVMLTLVVLVIGAVMTARLPLDLLPKIVYPNIRAGVNYPGVEPQVLEETVAKPLEAALSVTENIVRIETEVEEGRVGVNLHFRYGTNIDFALQDASKNLDRARARLPAEADPPTIFKFDPSQMAVYEVAFSSSDRDAVSLRAWAEDRLRPQLLSIDGVASVDVSGGLVREVQVLLDQERLRSYGLAVSQVIDAIRAANQNVAAGRVTGADLELVGRTEGKFRSVDEVRSLLLNVGGGRRVPLTEVAEVRDTHQEQRMWVRLDGVPAVKVSVRKQPDGNTVGIADQVHARIDRLSRDGFIPADLNFQIVNNQADFVRASVNSVRNAAMFGATLAMLVVLVFLRSLRKTLIIGLAIPIAIMATFALMGFFKLTLNIMSLGGLALGVGLLIDNAIVMLENIFRKRDEGIEDPVLAAHEGASQVQSAVVAATTTNLAAVLPFLLVSGLASLIFRELILTISFAIMASLLVALTLVPMLTAQLTKVRFTSGFDRSLPARAFDSGFESLRSGYRRAVGASLRFRWAVLGSAFAALVVAALLVRGLGNEFLPSVDDGGVSVGISLPPGIPPDHTNRIALELEEMVRQMPGVESVFSTAGGSLFGASTAARGGRGSLDVRLVPVTQRDFTAQSWVADMQAKVTERGFAGARVFVRPPRIRGLRTSISGSDVALTVYGEDLVMLRSKAEEIMRTITGIPGLDRVEASQDEGSPQLAIELDRERAGYLGLSVQQVGQTVRTALDGAIATRYTDGNREYDIRVMLPRARFTSPEAIGEVALFPGQRGGSPVYLRDVARVYTAIGPTNIRRENQSRVVRVTGDVVTEVAAVSVVNDSIRGRLAALEMPEGYGVLYGGEEEAIRENNRQLALVVFLAIFLVFVVLAVQYESLINPFVILMAIPLSLVGVGLALRLTGTPMSAPVLLGVILLAGIVVNNAILLVEYIEQARHRGLSMFDAVVESGTVRLRPVIMTSLTTMCGMLPLAIGLGQGSELMRPLAIAVVGGLAVSMVLTLFVVPSAYVILNTGGERLREFVLGKREAAEESPGGYPVPALGSGRAEVGAD
ncbi:MAG TPA: efflux RND transporter permease subunit [Gemmatimonadaceae bacterium]|nr:efflux RND transporter permease subunit [Gemmatimonadaceae bacterium]